MGQLQIYTMILAAGAVLLAVYGLMRRRRTPDDIERERREFLNRVGRITDGNVLDVQEVTTDGKSLQLIIYQYEIAGVEYNCSQDVTLLRHWVNLHSCRLGLPTSVKYDPQNPGNSIIVTEQWIGLRG
jgi:hypothetical protein